MIYHRIEYEVFGMYYDLGFIAPIILDELKGRKVVLAFECSGGCHGLNRTSLDDLTMYIIGNKIQVKTAHFQVIVNEDSDIETDIEIWKENIWITNKERTICEMVKYERDDFSIYEALENYDKSIEILKEKAKEYGLFEKLNRYIDTV